MFRLILSLLLFSVLGGAILAQPSFQIGSATCVLTWQEAPIPNLGWLTDIQVIAANDIWVSGTSDLLHWDGKSWTPFANPIQGSIKALDATSPTDVWAVGYFDTADFPIRHSFVLHWDGSEWKVAHTYPGDMHAAVVSLSADNVWIGGSHFWHWDGVEWKEIPMPETDEPAPFIRSFSAVSADDIWAVGYAGTHTEKAITLHWDGNEWTQVLGLRGDGSRSFLEGVAALAANDVWAVGYDTSGGDLIGHWNGSVWTRFDMTGRAMSAIAGTAPDHIYAAGEGIIRWDGKEWVLEETMPAELHGVGAVSENEIWAVGSIRHEDGSFTSYLTKGTLPCVEPTPTPEPTTPSFTPQPTEEACALNKLQLLQPKNKSTIQNKTVKLAWEAQPCATRYELVLRQDSKKGVQIVNKRVKSPHYRAASISAAHQYLWRVRACDASQCGAWSKWRRFRMQ